MAIYYVPPVPMTATGDGCKFYVLATMRQWKRASGKLRKGKDNQIDHKE